MEPNTLTYIIGIVALIAGIIAGKFIFAKNTQSKINEAEVEAAKTIAQAKTNAENQKNQKMLEAKEKFLQLKADYDKDVLERNRKLGDSENRIKQKEQTTSQKLEQLEKQIKDNEAIKETLNRQIE